MKLGILASGDLGLKCLGTLPGYASVECVFTDSGSRSIIEWCKQQNIPVFTGNPRNQRTTDFRRNFKIEVLFSINYLFLIEQDLIDWVEYAFNIHGSLLPKYRGRTPHVWAIINNESKTGLTVHLIDPGCDTGKIVLQKEVAIEKNMTGYDVLQCFHSMYPSAIAETLEMVRNRSINPKLQDNSRATYFGKRTPADGMINWDWQRERIFNWVRAQAKPYPGAFTLYKGQKLIIHKVEHDETGFHYEDANGTIIGLCNGNPVVKTSNGALQIIDYEINSGIQFTKGEVLHA
jgi:methionyl-tRNA formyltransferase